MTARPTTLGSFAEPERPGEASVRLVSCDPDDPAPFLWAVAALTGDWSAVSVSRVAGVPHDLARRAIERARDTGLVAADPSEPVDPVVVAGLVDLLSDVERSRIHAAAARACFRLGPDHHRRALRHARSAGAALPGPEVVGLLEQAGELSLILGAYDDARDLLAYADELDASGDPDVVGRRACRLAEACDGAGDAPGARAALMRAIAASETSDDPDLVARVAVQCALVAGVDRTDGRAERFLCRTGRVDLPASSRATVLAARALVEHRVPLAVEGGPTAGWVSRPGVARPLAERALALSTDAESRLVALLAWRSSHQSPEHLDLRRERSAEALDLAHRRHHAVWQVRAGVALAVDCIEGADRSGYDRAVDIVGWAALGDGSPRLRWQAGALETGRAFLDGDLAAAARLRERTAGFAAAADGLGSAVAGWWFAAQDAHGRGAPDLPPDLLLADHDPLVRNPVIAATVARWRAASGDLDGAEHALRRALAAFDPESTGLLLASRAAAAAVLLGVPELSATVTGLLEPWSGRVVVDPDGWWCDGPVDGWLALLGARSERSAPRAAALDLARRIRDVRSIGRLGVAPPVEPVIRLSERERRVLHLVVDGHTNAQIAASLSYSVSTIRQTLTTLYDRFGTRQRHELIDTARRLGVTSD